jgi:hypothetical protein
LLGERVGHAKFLFVKHDNVFGLLESITGLAGYNWTGTDLDL